ncbi:hypothetical protein LKO27_07375 [Tessaracoccus sp. OS52]|uniref:hypothetical protein n=1 Tax=Tessaracoccus sp. OS52 TaxID=2886691 RepID=UPI001D11792E|nr:hypothetical protein [Tessaracoccus sp. OS52]MCC2593227.1 hypothetical protein [Tessaracoccus sp. OS52]
MTDVLRRLATVLLLAGLPLLGSWLAAPSAQAAFHDGACTDDTGVTVVVDHQDLGGGIVVRCATDFPSGGTGLQALKLAGFVPEGTMKDGPAFVCRINNRPAADETLTVGGQDYRENCISTPPNEAFWGYWHAPAGGEWTFSQLGGGRTVEPGGYEGWSFSLNRGEDSNPRPGVVPAARPKPQPTSPKPAEPAPTAAATRPAPTTQPAATRTTATPSSPATTRRAEPPRKPTSPTTAATASSAPTAVASTVAASPPPTPSASASASPSPAASPAASAASASPTMTHSEEVATAAPVEAAPPPDGPGMGTYLGIGAAAALTAAGGAVWWRRRGAL